MSWRSRRRARGRSRDRSSRLALRAMAAPSVVRAESGVGPCLWCSGRPPSEGESGRGPARTAAVLLYGSVLLHEISHALAARAFEMPVTSINLHFLGGATEIEGEADHAVARVRDRGGRAADLAARSAQSPSSRSTCSTAGCCASPWPRWPAPTSWSACSTWCPGCRSTAAECSSRRSGRSPSGVRPASWSRPGAAGSPPWRRCAIAPLIMPAMGYQPTRHRLSGRVHARRVPLGRRHARPPGLEAAGPAAGHRRASSWPGRRSASRPTCRWPRASGARRRPGPARSWS